jgi:hypothetical protein
MSTKKKAAVKIVKKQTVKKVPSKKIEFKTPPLFRGPVEKDVNPHPPPYIPGKNKIWRWMETYRRYFRN